MKQELKTTDKAFFTTCTRPLITTDTNAYVVRIKVEGDECVQVKAHRADGTSVSGTGSVNDGSGYSEYTLSKDMYAIPGRLVLTVAVVSGKNCTTVRMIECVVME